MSFIPSVIKFIYNTLYRLLCPMCCRLEVFIHWKQLVLSVDVSCHRGVQLPFFPFCTGSMFLSLIITCMCVCVRYYNCTTENEDAKSYVYITCRIIIYVDVIKTSVLCNKITLACFHVKHTLF